MNDKEFWMMVRRALLMICSAIEKKYPGKDQVLEVDETASFTFFDDDKS